MDDPEAKRRKTFDLRLTKIELLHLRDLFNVALPPEMKTTVSQALAQAQDRALVEPRLWQKIAATCRSAGLPLDEDAPDFVVTAVGPPSLGVFELAHEPLSPTDDESGLEAAVDQAKRILTEETD